MTLNTSPGLTYLHNIPLKHPGADCALLGVMPGSRTIYSEEIYTDDAWIARHMHTFEGEQLHSVDEDHGRVQDFSPIEPPPEALRPSAGWHTQMLNYRGPRHRGMRDEERIDRVVRPISIAARMDLLRRLRLDLPPPLVLGLAESYVISEAMLLPPDDFVVCRRLRLAYALTETRHDAEGQPYNYDTLVFHVIHRYDRATGDAEVPVETALAGLPGAALNRPLDCLLCDGHLFVADGGTAEAPGAVHIWRVQG